jgi:transposase
MPISEYRKIVTAADLREVSRYKFEDHEPLTRREAAALLGYSVKTVDRYLSKHGHQGKRLKSYGTGRNLRITRAAILEFQN